jgi:hypothetical protein
VGGAVLSEAKLALPAIEPSNGMEIKAMKELDEAAVPAEAGMSFGLNPIRARARHQRRRGARHFAM